MRSKGRRKVCRGRTREVASKDRMGGRPKGVKAMTERALLW
jgi:hypothetical protein